MSCPLPRRRLRAKGNRERRGASSPMILAPGHFSRSNSARESDAGPSLERAPPDSAIDILVLFCHNAFIKTR